MSTVARENRFTRDNPCPICGGGQDERRGQGERCYGFMSDDGMWAHCTREEYAGSLERHDESNTYAHRLDGNCSCGVEHGHTLAENTTGKPSSGKGGRARKTLVRHYLYEINRGTPLFRVDRYSDKSFRQYRWSNGTWLPGLGDTKPVLYKLPELIRAAPSTPVFIPEGEKDVDHLLGLELVATTNPMGAGKWRDDYNQYLQGRDVVTLADNDDPGRRHADDVARRLRGIAARIRLVTFDDLPQGGDVSDWLEAGHTKEQLLERVDNTPEWPADDTFSIADLMAEELPEIRWAVPGLLPEGLAVLIAPPKMGKSWLALNVLIEKARGGKVLGSIDVESGKVLYLDLEDGKRRLQNRCKAVLAGTSAPADFRYKLDWPAMDKGGLEKLDDHLTPNPDIELVVIDIFQRVRPSRKRGGDVYAEDYEAAKMLHDVALKHHVCIMAVHHANKREWSDDPVDLCSGSHGLTGAADTILVFMRKREQKDAVLWAFGREDVQSLKLVWSDETCTWTAVAPADYDDLTPARRLRSRQAITRGFMV